MQYQATGYAAPPSSQQPVVVVPAQQQQPQYPVQYQPAPVQFVPMQPSMVPVHGQTVVPPLTAGEYVQPSHNLILAMIVTIICALANLTSLMIGGPALVCAVMAYNALKQQRYSTTKNLGYTAAVLSVLNIAYTGVVTIVIVGVAIGCSPRTRYYYSYYSDYSYSYSYSNCS